MAHLDQIPNYLDQTLQNNDQNIQNITKLPCVPSPSLGINFDLVRHPQCCAANYLQKFLPIGPQHNLVALPRAMSVAGNSVATDLHLEFLILLGKFLDMFFNFVSNLLDCCQVMLQWVLFNICSDILLSFLNLS